MNGFGQMTVDATTAAITSGLIVIDPTTGRPSTASPNYTPDEIEQMQVEAAGYLQTIQPAKQPGAIQNWIEQNKTAVYVGAGILALMAIMGRRRR